MRQKMSLIKGDSQGIQETINKKSRKIIVWIYFKLNKWYKILMEENTHKFEKVLFGHI